MTETTDEELIARYRESGAVGCLNTLVGRHTGRVRAMIYPMVLNAADADDLTQEVFLKVGRGIDGFGGRASFATWLYRIAMNTTLDFLRRRGRRARVETSGELAPEAHDPQAGPDRRAAAADAHHAVEAAIAALAPKLRAAITLTVLEGYSVTEAARIANCLSATMHWRVHEARRQLKERLKE